MARNIEIKVRVPDLSRTSSAAGGIGGRLAWTLRQTDTFFDAPRGRLTLRELGDGTAELIAYDRTDAPSARPSDYERRPVANPRDLARVLARSLGERGRVEKERTLYLYGHTRIRLDAVRGLGTFVELETVLSDQGEADAHLEIAHVFAALGLDRGGGRPRVRGPAAREPGRRGRWTKRAV